jgi:hypothetical protein
MTTPKPALARVLKRLHEPPEVIRTDFCCVPIVTKPRRSATLLREVNRPER